jgi:hypothetical protein
MCLNEGAFTRGGRSRLDSLLPRQTDYWLRVYFVISRAYELGQSRLTRQIRFYQAEPRDRFRFRSESASDRRRKLKARQRCARALPRAVSPLSLISRYFIFRLIILITASIVPLPCSDFRHSAFDESNMPRRSMTPLSASHSRISLRINRRP